MSDRFLGEATYEFDARLGKDELWTLYAEKSWLELDEREFGMTAVTESLKLATGEGGLVQTSEALNGLIENGEQDIAMQRAEKLAIENGFLDPKRDDPRLFLSGPDDPFATLREIEQDAAREAYTQFTEAYETANPAAYVPTPADLAEMAQAFAEMNLDVPLQEEPEIDL
jgi:hypothetical protein